MPGLEAKEQELSDSVERLEIQIRDLSSQPKLSKPCFPLEAEPNKVGEPIR